MRTAVTITIESVIVDNYSEWLCIIRKLNKKKMQ